MLAEYHDRDSVLRVPERLPGLERSGPEILHFRMRVDDPNRSASFRYRLVYCWAAAYSLLDDLPVGVLLDHLAITKL